MGSSTKSTKSTALSGSSLPKVGMAGPKESNMTQKGNSNTSNSNMKK